MVSLTNEQYELINFYYYLLNTIEEGFDYIIDSFSNLELTEGDKLFKDILSALYHIDSSHLTLQALFNEDQDVLESVKKFDCVIVTLENESSIVASLESHQLFVKNQLAPAYVAWKETVQTQLQPYIIQ